MMTSPARCILTGAALLLLAACAGGEPRTPIKVVDEIPEGPGVFTGKDGKLVIY